MSSTSPGRDTTAIAFEHMTGLMRGAMTWLNGSTLDVVLDSDCMIQVDEARGGQPDPGLVARLHRVDDTYEVQAKGGQKVWVNGKLVKSQRLRHGDTVEFCETGPLCRLRVYKEHGPVRNSVSDIVADVATYLRVSRQRPAKRLMRAGGALFGRLAHETSILFRVTVLAAILVFGYLAWQQALLNKMLRAQIEANATQLDAVAGAFGNAQKEALRPSDLEALRQQLEERVISNVTRLEELEQRTTASARVIAEAGTRVVFLQGMYGFRERGSDRMLRQAVNSDGVPMMSFRGRPLLTLDGAGPVVELQFTGTGFFVGTGGALVTNRHVALPWEQSAGIDGIGLDVVEPVMLRFIAYRLGQPDPVAVSLIAASDQADLAVLRLEGPAPEVAGLPLAEQLPRSGEEVIVLGYPTGLRSMLAQSGAAFIKELQDAGTTGFWDVAARLATAGFIAPLASRGIVGQATASTVVYDAETTHGGSGGPVLDINGRVIAVNSAILPEYGGSNLGVPAKAVQELLAGAGML